MIDEVRIEPMKEEFILWRCLHNGPLSSETIDRVPPESKMPWDRFRERNIPLLIKLTRIYGACAMVARDGDDIVGTLRFYPKVVCDRVDSEGFCLQQPFPSGPAEEVGAQDFPAPAQIIDKTLKVHCLMTGSAQQPESPYQRKGVGTRMVKTLIQWARANGWKHIEADSFEDLPIIYEITGSAGHRFWEKLGFYMADRHPHPSLQGQDQFVMTLEQQAQASGISPERAKDQLVMRLNLT